MEMRTLFYETFVQMADLSGDLLLLHVLKDGRDEDLYWIESHYLHVCVAHIDAQALAWVDQHRCRYFSGASINLFALSAGCAS